MRYTFHFLRSKQNLYFRQASQPLADTTENYSLERSSTVTYKFPSERPRRVKRASRSWDQPVSQDMPSVPEGERYTLEAAEIASVEGVTREISTEEVKAEPKEVGQEGVKKENKEGEEEINQEGVKNIYEGEAVKTESEEINQEGVKNEKEEGGDQDVETESAEEQMRTRTRSIDEELSDLPSFKFITRPDLYKFAKVSGFLN